MMKKSTYIRLAKWGFGLIISLFFILNILVAVQAYSFTHFVNTEASPEDSKDMSTIGLSHLLLTGIELPRPESLTLPKIPYELINIPTGDNKNICGWLLKAQTPKKGIVLFFHGYMNDKTLLLDYAYEFTTMGYDALLIDFMGAGCSYGNQTTIGYKEAEDVKTTFDYAKTRMKEKRIFLMGFSMGAAAILKAQHDYGLPANGIIAEASYGKLFDTIKARAEIMGLGKASKAGTYLFSFWMSVTNFIDVFDMEPDCYVKHITIPTLIACGGKDQYIPREETLRIYENLSSKHKKLIFYPESKHELYIYKYPTEWRNNIQLFLDNIK